MGDMAVAAVENPVLDKIISFMNDNSYSELTQNTAKFNVRIRRDRRYRQPYIDGQTGVAQRDCHLFVSLRQRQPGQVQGQVFSYPQRRWKAPHRSYLRAFVQVRQQPPAVVRDPEEHIITTVENPAAALAAVGAAASAVVPGAAVIAAATNSNGVVEQEGVPEKVKETWAYYEDAGFDDIEEDIETDDNDDDETYDRKGRKRKTPGKKAKVRPGSSLPRRDGPSQGSSKSTKKKSQPKTPGKGGGGSKKSRASAGGGAAADDNNDDPESKPYHCERKASRKSLLQSGKQSAAGGAVTPTKSGTAAAVSTPNSIHGPGAANSTGAPSGAPHKNGDAGPNSAAAAAIDAKKKVAPSPYCDFCLGDSSINKKTMAPENLVSCADCGRSGHPTCLQFTANMMKSVSNYRWQCIECKTCTLCGTSENDDQLLFCDDCDRGYHLYCLSPPLAEPPEGEWSCSLCIKNFHTTSKPK